MKNLLTFFFIVCTGILFSGCPTGRSELERHIFLFNENLKTYPDSLINHFPSLEDERKISKLSFGPANTQLLKRIYVVINQDEENMIDIKKQLTDSSIAIYHLTDSCLLITNEEDMIYIRNTGLQQNCDKEGLLPIPNFNFMDPVGTFNRSYNNLEIYVLAAGSDFPLDPEYLPQKEVGLSGKWEHGYTKGIAISNTLVAYWLEVW